MELVKMAQTLVINAVCLPPTTDTSTAVQLPVEVLLSMEETKRAVEETKRLLSMEETKRVLAVERTKQMTLEFEMMQFRFAHPLAT